MTATDTTSTVVVGFPGPEPQRRLTVAFRLVLLIPHFIWFVLLSIAAYLAVIVGWFAALFIGRLPRGIATFVTRWLQYTTRVSAYGYLLTDRYPPFGDSDDYPLSVEITPTRLNRWAVLFRLILLVPVGIVQAIVSSGLTTALVVVWLIVLITGRMPRSVFEAEAAVLRYVTRFTAFASMLTSDYPNGLFGDRDQVEITPPASDEAGAEVILPTTPRVTRLTLSRAGRRLVVLFIVLGVVVQGGAAASAAARAAKTNVTRRELTRAHNQIEAAVQRFARESQGCALSGGPECLHAADERLATSFDRFDRDLQAIAFPDPSLGRAEQLQSDTRALAALMRKLAGINDAATYQAQATTFQSEADTFDRDYQDLFLLLGI